MTALIIRSELKFWFDDETRWYADKARVTALVDAFLDAPLGRRIRHAGVFGKERPVKDAAAIRKAIVTGKATSYAMLDAKAQHEATTFITLDLEPDAFSASMLLQGKALASVAATLFVDLETIAQKLATRTRDLGGLGLGFAHPMSDSGFAYPRPRPPVTHRRYEVSSVLDFVDKRFHESEHERARPEDATRLATTATPKRVARTDRDGLLSMRWIDGCDDERALAVASGHHEMWIASALACDPDEEWNEHGDQLVEPHSRSRRAPFTFFDPEEKVGYKAIVVDAKGKPDPEIWKEMTAALASRGKSVEAIRLVAPVRKSAIAIADRARKAGFDAVVYPDDDDQLWNPTPEGWWIEDEA